MGKKRGGKTVAKKTRPEPIVFGGGSVSVTAVSYFGGGHGNDVASSGANGGSAVEKDDGTKEANDGGGAASDVCGEGADKTGDGIKEADGGGATGEDLVIDDDMFMDTEGDATITGGAGEDDVGNKEAIDGGAVEGGVAITGSAGKDDVGSKEANDGGVTGEELVINDDMFMDDGGATEGDVVITGSASKDDDGAKEANDGGATGKDEDGGAVEKENVSNTEASMVGQRRILCEIDDDESEPFIPSGRIWTPNINTSLKSISELRDYVGRRLQYSVTSLVECLSPDLDVCVPFFLMMYCKIDKTDRLFTQYVEATKPIVKAALQICDRIAAEAPAPGDTNANQYAVRYKGAHQQDIFEVTVWRKNDASHHEDASRIVIKGTKRLFRNGVPKDFTLQMFIDDPSQVDSNVVKLVNNYVDLLNDAARDLDIPSWLNSVHIEFVDSEFMIGKSAPPKTTVTQSLALYLFHIDKSVETMINKVAFSVELFPRAVSMACAVGPPAMSTLSLTPLYHVKDGLRVRDIPSVRMDYDVYFAGVFIQQEVIGILESHKILWTEDFLAVESHDKKTYHVLLAQSHADLVREPCFDIRVKTSDNADHKEFITNMVDVARANIKKIRAATGPDDSDLALLAGNSKFRLAAFRELHEVLKTREQRHGQVNMETLNFNGIYGWYWKPHVERSRTFETDFESALSTVNMRSVWYLTTLMGESVTLRTIMEDSALNPNKINKHFTKSFMDKVERAAVNMTVEDIEHALHLYAMARWKMAVKNDFLTRRPIFFSPPTGSAQTVAPDIFNLLLEHVAFDAITAANETGDEKEAAEILEQELSMMGRGKGKRKMSGVGGGRTKRKGGKLVGGGKRARKDATCNSTPIRRRASDEPGSCDRSVKSRGMVRYQEMNDREIERCQKEEDAAASANKRKKGPMHRLVRNMENRIMNHISTLFKEQERTLRQVIDRYLRGDFLDEPDNAGGHHKAASSGASGGGRAHDDDDDMEMSEDSGEEEEDDEDEEEE